MEPKIGGATECLVKLVHAWEKKSVGRKNVGRISYSPPKDRFETVREIRTPKIMNTEA